MEEQIDQENALEEAVLADQNEDTANVEIELEDFFRVRINIYDSEPTYVEVSARVENHEIKVEDLKRRVCQQLGLSQENWQYFVIVKGEWPHRKYKPTDTLETNITIFQDIFLHKWVFDTTVEEQFFRDPMTIHLLYQQAKYNIEIGKIRPNQQQLDELPGVFEFDYRQEAEFIRQCQMLPYYHSYMFDCKIHMDFPESSKLLQQGHRCKLYVTRDSIQVHQDDLVAYAYWTKIRSWRCRHKVKLIEFELAMSTGVARWLRWLQLETWQTQFILSVMSETVFDVQRREGLIQGFFASMVLKQTDEVLHLANPVFSPETKDNPMYSPAAADGSTSLEDCVDPAFRIRGPVDLCCLNGT